MQFTAHHFVAHREHLVGIQALNHLAERGRSTEIIENGGFPLIQAVTFFEWDDRDVPGKESRRKDFPNKYLRVVPHTPPADHSLDLEMLCKARSYTWMAPNAIPVAISLRHASASGLFERDALKGLCSALDNLCGYRTWTKHEKRERYMARRTAREEREGGVAKTGWWFD